MLDLHHLEQYRENNRIEAKKALGGLPHSIWETYSAFANTLGGIILLGVEEHRDKSLHPVDLPDPEKLVREFWALVNEPKKASVNILSPEDITVEDIQGDHIVVIRVPRAERTDKPVYVEGDPRNTYRRSGEGDYKCTAEELYAMYRDAALRTQDMRLLAGVDMDALNAASLRTYRRRMRLARPGHPWNALDDGEFLQQIDAAGIDRDGGGHPTAAGLLMFGGVGDIARVYPSYLLEYRRADDDGGGWAVSLSSSGGEWSGNIFDFYCRVYDGLRRGLETFLGPEEDSGPVDRAVREALANCLVNGDYYGKGGLRIIQRPGEITMTNPGSFRIRMAAARSGGRSDPRNSAMGKMLHLIGAGERTGSGIPRIFQVWQDRGWAEPAIRQMFAPDRTTLTLLLAPPEGRGATAQGTGARSGERQQAAVIEYLTDNVSAQPAVLAEYLGVSVTQADQVLSALMAQDIVVAQGEGEERTYRLKA